MKLKKIISSIESYAPLSLQESYDNAGLIVGSANADIDKALICFDVTEEVIEEAISIGANLIISHHPIIFGGIKKLNGKNYVERIVIKAIKNDIALYAAHTNLDNIINGTNKILADKLGLKNIKTLNPQRGILNKLVVYTPISHKQQVQQAIFEAGAGHIGNYDSCSFESDGLGSFRANGQANPFVGNIGELHKEKEIRLETIFPSHLKGQIINALLQAHPYEEVAYDIYKVENNISNIGAGIIGELPEATDELPFLNSIKNITKAQGIKYTNLLNKKIKKVAICGGSGAFLINTAKSAGADVYITGDIKYHEYFDADNSILLADIGHYESEQFTNTLLFSIIKEKIPTFAVQISDINTNPVNYL
ncbi:MAG: Nif3-like dinuclear metal center hexameric protein [Bacteroidetes bacterium 4572_112]|nr:MAG: Nif3-like dinuclear metal center hexameric protein [Bacteroidetes bacterium 4572_112]